MAVDDGSTAGAAVSVSQGSDGAVAAGSRDAEVKRDLSAGAAESRSEASARRGQDPAAARRLKELAESRARLDRMAMGTQGKGFKTMTSAEVARQAQADAARRQALASGASSSRGGGARAAAPMETKRLFQALINDSPGPAPGGERVEVFRGLPANIVCAICAELQRSLGDAEALRLAGAQWFCDLERWRNFKRDVAQLVESVDDVEEYGILVMLNELGLLAELIFGVSNQARSQAALDVHLTTSDEQAIARLRDRGYERRFGKLWGRNNCLADSLLQLLVIHRVIHGDRLDGELSDQWRRDACNANRNRLCANPVLHPRDGRGSQDSEAYLQHHVHARSTLEFFLDAGQCPAFRVRDGVPDAGIVLVVHTRYDEDVLAAGIIDRTTYLDRVGAVDAPLEFHLYCHTGDDIRGYHYDPLVFDRSTRRRTGPVHQNRDSRPLRRHHAIGGREREDVALPASRGDVTEEALSLDLVQVVLSDGEGGQEANAPARARRLLRRASSEIALGHADTVLAARLERTTVTSASAPRVQGDGGVPGQIDGAAAAPANAQVAVAFREESVGSSATQPDSASLSVCVATAFDLAPGGGAFSSEHVSVTSPAAPPVHVAERISGQDRGVGSQLAAVSAGPVAGARDGLPVESLSSGGRGRRSAALPAPPAAHGSELGIRRSTRIAARMEAIAGYGGPSGPAASPAAHARGSGSSDKGRGRGRGRGS